MNESLDSTVLSNLANILELDDDINNEEILATIGLHKNSDTDTLRILASSPFENVRAATALNLNATPDIIKKVSTTTSLKLPSFKTSYCWWDTPTSNWANATNENLNKLSILGFV